MIAMIIAITIHATTPAVTPVIKVAPTPQLQAWQMDGIVVALADKSPEVKSIALGKIHEFEPSELQKFPLQSNQIAAYAIEQLNDLDDAVKRNRRYPLGSKKYLQAASTLKRLGKIDNHIVKLLTKRVNKSKSDYDSFKVGVAEILVDLGKADAETLKFIIDRAKDSRPDVTFGQDSAIHALETLGKSDPKIVEFLFDRFKNEDLFKTKATAASVLIKLNKQDESVMKLLLETIQRPKIGLKIDTFRSFSFGALAHLKKADAKTIDLLLSLFRSEDEDLSRGASGVLVSLGKGDDTIIKRLSEILTNPNESQKFKYQVLMILAEIQKIDSRVLAVLKDFVHNSQDLDLRLSSASLLVTFQNIDRPLITFLTDTIATPHRIPDSDRINAAKILGEIQPLDFKQLRTFLETTPESGVPNVEERRFWVYYYNRGHHNLEALFSTMTNSGL